MLPHRDDLEVLARLADLLLEIRDPTELAQRFLENIAGVFGADAGVLLLQDREIPSVLTPLGLERGQASRLAAELRRALRKSGETRRIWGAGEGDGAWPNTLVTTIPTRPDRESLLALFASRPDAFDFGRDMRLVDLMLRQAVVALDRASRHTDSSREAERLAVQAEEIERVHQALERHSREIERSLALRSRFFAAMSHELRTPLNAIVGYSELLHKGIYGKLSQRQLEVAEKIESSATQLLALVNEILDFSKIEAGKMEVHLRPLDLPMLLAEATAAVEPAARIKGLELRIDCEAPLPANESDPGKVRQILLNLLSNAVKFTARGSVTIEVRHLRERAASPFPAAPSCAPGDEGWIGIAVRDTGVGIPDAQRQAIFGEFVQLPQPDHSPPGTGLGLAISSRIARLLGGELAVDSELGIQSTFMLFLPCPAPRQDPGPPAREESGAATAGGI